MNVLYGIPNCDTVRKARKWLDAQGIAYRFHDYKKAGLDAATLARWCDELGWEVLLNRRGTTWRRLPDDIKAGIDAEAAQALMVEQPSIVRRPVLDTGQSRHVGFSPEQYRTIFG